MLTMSQAISAFRGPFTLIITAKSLPTILASTWPYYKPKMQAQNLHLLGICHFFCFFRDTLMLIQLSPNLCLS